MQHLSRRSLLAGLGALGLAGCAPGASGARLAVPGRAGTSVHRPIGEDDGFAGADASSDAPRTEGSATTSHAPEPVAAPQVPTLDLPPREAGAETGSAFLERNEGLGRAAMDEAVVEAILAGNVPAWLRPLCPVRVEERGVSLTLHVACDYLAVGSDDDFVRMPMTAAAAQRIANRLGAALPTTKLVDAIYAAAPCKLPPSFIEGGPTEGTLADYALHHEKLEAHRARGRHALGTLTAGHKKDIVLCDRLVERPDRVAIYGWHRRESDVIQPLSTLHSCRYADYSHGVRLLDQRVFVGDDPRRLSELLSDPSLAWLVSEEGPLSVTSYPTTLPPYEGPRGKRRKRRG